MVEPGSDEAPAASSASSSPAPGRARRARAPTITLDTSAVGPVPTSTGEDPLLGDAGVNCRQSQHPRAPSVDDAPSLAAPTSGGASHVTRHTRTTSGSDGIDSRPTSPHNVSSLTHKGQEQHTFLAVPDRHSRRSSLGSDEASPTQTSFGGETIVPTPSPSGPGPPSPAGCIGIDPDHDLTSSSILGAADDALKPDPGTEANFDVSDQPFAFSPGQLGKLVDPKSLAAFYALGGLRGLERGLRSDVRAGLSVDETGLDGHVSIDDARTAAAAAAAVVDGVSPPRPDVEPITVSLGPDPDPDPTTGHRPDREAFADRRRIFTVNRLPEKKGKNFFQLAWIAYKDKVLILLTVAAIVALALGLYRTFGLPHPPGEPSVDWVEGVAIMVAVIIVVLVGAANDYQKERQFVKLNRRKEDRSVNVIRSGRSREVSVYDLLVGDVIHLEPGDLVPVDGVLIQGHAVRCDESSATGESDLIKKQPAQEVYDAIVARRGTRKLDPFILSGSKVTEGVGTFLVTAVGVHSVHGKTMISLREDVEATPLTLKLNVLAEQIAKLGGAAALLLFVVLLIKFLAQLPHNHETPSKKGQNFMQILIVAVTVVVVAVPEGLPLAVTLALAFATTRMLKDNNLVRLLRACETMGNATTVCSDKTGTLTQNKMTVVAGSVGTTSRFGDRALISPDSPPSPLAKATSAFDEEKDGDGDVSAAGLVSTLADEVKVALLQSMVLNSTAFEGAEDGRSTFIGSKTETALLSFARDHLGMQSIDVERANAQVVQLVPFDSGRKCMAVVVRLSHGRFRMYVKGASEILVTKCARIVSRPTKALTDGPLTEDNAQTLRAMIASYASRSLRTLALVYRDYGSWPPEGAAMLAGDAEQADFDDVFHDMVLLGLVGIQDPLREGVPDSVRQCQRAGVFVRMVTGDNVLTARAIADQCGILIKGGLVMEGPKFRTLNKAQMDRVIPRLRVLARSSPEDKRILVRRLKELGETVAVTGDGTNDAPALKMADVGFSMGITGTEVAKEASAIILMDDNFSSIVKAIMWGRAVNDAVKKFLQFQVTVNITAVILTFVSAVSNPREESVLKAVQLLWVNLIMDTFAALALATDPPAPSILDRKPDRKSAPLITVTMWKMIIGQAIYQLAVTLILYFAGAKILSYDTPYEKDQLETLVFNTFVWMQIFNQLNNRRLDNKFNIFEGIWRNKFFIFINCVMVGGQVMIIFVGRRALSVTPLNGVQWSISIVLGALSVPIGLVIRLVPDAMVARFLPRLTRKKTPQVVVTDEDQRYEWNRGIEEIREELYFLKRLRGGRLNAIKFRLQHPRETLMPIVRSRSGSRSRSSSTPQTPTGEGTMEFGSVSLHTPESRTRHRSRSNSAFGPAAAMAGVVAGSIAGWSPIDRTQAEHEFPPIAAGTDSETPHYNPTDPGHVAPGVTMNTIEPPSHHNVGQSPQVIDEVRPSSDGIAETDFGQEQKKIHALSSDKP